ncbi:hypothetical protein ABB37_03247 [Leptomonas pyrrhocoris]|uniref:Uncharacterized protein n=1 Tax=Leptomonas pyrrhocoris TaxID=157538 RepID=A0A0M9G4R6_LEPPY|nr:hypothetical protein ABB37_03247 [Leptomonas pyrrhocoris]KPA82099.1 hypothetical protein ABB37_03247 [Leptomonas pyrrhocoris]|eukprot:XP_015660538.1 hypothetical protein ABB37_03247 [Leptomonas pyrrhocoris]
MSQSAAHRTPYDWNAGVRVRVQRACQAPFYSVFREENTRQVDNVYEGHLGAASATSPPTIQEDDRRLLYFPYHNKASAQRTMQAADDVAPETVTLVGATGMMGKFVAEQYLRRGICVTVLARDIEKAKALFLPIADGGRERNRAASMGYVQLLGSAEQPVLTAAVDYTDAQREDRRVLRYEFRTSHTTPNAETGGNNTSAAPTTGATSREGRRVTLELIEGDVASASDLEFSMRHASVVFYLAAALEEAAGPSLWADGRPSSPSLSWLSPSSWFGSSSRFGGFLRAFDACRRVDAHFVALTPLWVHGSRLSPFYWYRRLVSHPRGYCKAVWLQEQTLLSQWGHPSPRCYFGIDEVDERQFGGDWDYWRRIWFSTELPDDFPLLSRSPVRFSLFRLSDIVFPSFNERVVAAKNNRVDDGMHVNSVGQGDLDARLLSNVLVKSIALCKSVVQSRIDVGGRLRDGVDMHDAGAMFDLFEQFRNE